MFKVIHKNKIIDILEKLVYVRYLPKLKRFVNTDKTSAHGVRGSNITDIYLLEGVKPLPVDNPRVLVVKIDEEEYNKIRDIMSYTIDVEDEGPELRTIRQCKIEEMSKSCNEAIISGIDVYLSDGKKHNFKLTIEDQLNLQSFRYQISKGVTKILFHETDTIVRWFKSSDITRIIDAADRHKNKHTTYYNLLKHCIHNMYNKDDIESIYYGIKLETLPAPKNVQFNLKEYNIV